MISSEICPTLQFLIMHKIMNYIEQELFSAFRQLERKMAKCFKKMLSELGDVVEHVGGTYFLARPNF